MLYDLNIPWTPSTSPSELEQTLKTLSHLGYTAAALNHTITSPLPSVITNPLPTSLPSPTKLPTLLRRATITISDPTTNHRLPALSAAYDLLAVRPTTEKAFLAACTALSDASIISLDLSVPLGFYFRPKPCMAAVKRGLRFEVCYGQLLAAQDERARALWIGNFAGLVRATRGRGILVSSEAGGAVQVRGKADVVNLLAVWGLSAERGAEGMGGVARGVVVNEGLKRRGFRGVVDIVRSAGREDDGQEGGGEEDRERVKQGVKRKASGGGDGDEAAGSKPMSKSQAKKLLKRQKADEVQG